MTRSDDIGIAISVAPEFAANALYIKGVVIVNLCLMLDKRGMDARRQR